MIEEQEKNQLKKINDILYLRKEMYEFLKPHPEYFNKSSRSMLVTVAQNGLITKSCLKKSSLKKINLNFMRLIWKKYGTLYDLLKNQLTSKIKWTIQMLINHI